MRVLRLRTKYRILQKPGYAPQFRGACFDRIRCRVRRCILRRRAVFRQDTLQGAAVHLEAAGGL